MKHLTQSPTDPDFVQDPYPFYDRARQTGDLFFWEDYGLVCAVSHGAVRAALRDRRMGRAIPAEKAQAVPEHLAPFYAVEAHSMLELEPPVHTRLRGLVLRAFTSRRIAALSPEIEALARGLVDAFPEGPFDLLDHFARPLPVRIIARLLGVPEADERRLLAWSNAMVAMYQARRTRAIEEAAARAASEFTAYIRDYVEVKRGQPGDDLITVLIAAEEDGERLSTDELVTTCILLLNAGHEATVHTLGIGAKTLMEQGLREVTPAVVEEVLRYDPPLHMFTRHAYEDFEFYGHEVKRGDEIACLLGAANRDGSVYEAPGRFDPARSAPANVAFGAGIHFCVGAPLARLEIEIGLRVLFEACPGLRMVEEPRFGDGYHFHGLERLRVAR